MGFPKAGQIQVYLTLTAVLALFGCGSDKTTGTEGQTSKALQYSIDETFNGVRCLYQSPVYASYADYCEALQDSTLNQDHGRECGRDYRHTLFDQELNCDGEFNPTLVIGHADPGPRAQ